MNSLKKTFIVSTAIISFVGCTFHTDKKEPDTKIDFAFKKGNMLNSEDWKCTDIEDEKICVPSSWNIMEQKKVFFLSKLDNNDINSYFVVTKYNKIESGLNIDKYLKETYLQFKKDTIEVFIGYTVKRLAFNDKTTYYGEYYTKIKNKEYLTYSTVFEKENNLFEIALKVDSVNSGLYKEQYKDILFNFYHKERVVFSATDELKDIQVVDISKLRSP